MKTHTVIDGNAFYEIDEECYEKLKQREQREMNRSLNEPGNRRNGRQEGKLPMMENHKTESKNHGGRCQKHSCTGL
jgi:hypothetical protein